jgi:hypothetical protein
MVTLPSCNSGKTPVFFASFSTKIFLKIITSVPVFMQKKSPTDQNHLTYIPRTPVESSPSDVGMYIPTCLHHLLYTYMVLPLLIDRRLIDRQLINRQLIDYLFVDRQLIDRQLIDPDNWSTPTIDRLFTTSTPPFCRSIFYNIDPPFRD